MQMMLSEITKLFGQSALEDFCITSVVTDSRKVVPGCAFICIKGENVDGHDFAALAVKNGAKLIISEKKLELDDISIVVVENSIKALGEIAKLWRERTRAKVIGVTGTAGKTTVKEILSHCLALKGKTAKNEMNFNNQIGLPISILNTDGDEDFWVMELGISEAHDMDELGQILRPDIAVILNAGAGHVEGLGQNVAKHKASLLKHLKDRFSVGIINADNENLVHEAMQIPVTKLYFSANENPIAGYSSKYLRKIKNKGLYYLNVLGEQYELTAPFVSSVGAENISAIAAVCNLCRLECGELCTGISTAKLPSQRFVIKKINNFTIIDDSYNANSLSFAKMIESASELANGENLIGIFGEMAELGELSSIEHEKLGQKIAENPFKIIFWKGKYFNEIQEALKATDIKLFALNEDFELVKNNMADFKGGVVLCKGSRSNHLEIILEKFKVWAENVI